MVLAGETEHGSGDGSFGQVLALQANLNAAEGG